MVKTATQWPLSVDGGMPGISVWHAYFLTNDRLDILIQITVIYCNMNQISKNWDPGGIPVVFTGMRVVSREQFPLFCLDHHDDTDQS